MTIDNEHPINHQIDHLLASPALFSEMIIKLPLRRYQLKPIQAVLDSCLHQRGLEFLWIFPRQSGKDEAVAHMEVYLMTLLQRRGANLIHVYPTTPQISIGVLCLEERLENPWTGGRWHSAAKPIRRCLGQK